jgi:hypothetical protein
MSDLSSQQRAVDYARLAGTELMLDWPLGSGTDGTVWKSTRDTAIKALDNEAGYWNEHDSYRRLAEFGLDHRIDEFVVPSLLGCSDQLRVIEIDLVLPPYIIDFAKVRIDRPPDFPEEVIQHYEAQCAEWFGGHWPDVRRLLAALESIGIYYLDARPSNIVFHDAH